jgi:hypothetical protein
VQRFRKKEIIGLKIGRFAIRQMAKKTKENKVIFGDVQEFTEPEEEKAPKKKKEKSSGIKELKPLRFLKDERFIKSLGLIFIFLAIFLLLSGISFLVTWQGDQSLVKEMSWGTLVLSEPGISENTLGILGAWISYIFIYKGFGLASFSFVVIFLAIGIVLLTSTEPIPISATLRYSFFTGIWLSLSLGFLFGNQLPVLAGSFGYFGSLYLSGLLGSAGAGLALVLYVLIFFVAVFNIKFFEPKIDLNKNQVQKSENTIAGIDKAEFDETEELPALNPDDFILKNKEEEIEPEPFIPLNEDEPVAEEIKEEKSLLEIIPSAEDEPEEEMIQIHVPEEIPQKIEAEFTGEEELVQPIITGSGLVVEVQDIQDEETKEEGTVRKVYDLAALKQIAGFSESIEKLCNNLNIGKYSYNNIKNYVDRVGSFVVTAKITEEIKLLLADKKADSNSVSAKTQLNENDLTRGANQKKSKKNQPSSEDKEQEDVAEAKIRYALKQVYELVSIAWAENTEIKSMHDVINYKDVGIVYEITGLSPSEWKKTLPAIDVIGMDRAIGQFNAI